LSINRKRGNEMLTKIIDKLLDPIEYLFLKKFKINTNEFFAYILTLMALYFTIDRIFEVFHVVFNGEFVNYWTTIEYTLVYACIVFAYMVTCASPMNKTIRHSLKFFLYYSILFYIVFFGMVVQWMNELLWIVVMRFDNFNYIVANMPEVIIPALASASAIAPVFTIKSLVSYYLNYVYDDNDFIESFEDYTGFKLESAKSKEKTPSAFMCDAVICIDELSGNQAKIPESKRFEATLVQGATGTGKTATIVEPMCAMDIERKYFFREVSKKLGYNALQAGLAILEGPYSNEFLSKNFSLSYLTHKENRFNEYKEYVNDMVKYVDSENKKIFYRDLGFTLVAPDNACIERIKKVAKAYEMPINVIDPMDPNSFGINPFTGSDPAKVASIISTVLKGMYEAESTGGDNIFFANVTQQAFENLAILLKLVYPRMHDGEMPTLEDMLAILNNFDMAEEMCEALKKDPVLSEDYKSLIGYLEKNFYKPPVNIHGYEIVSTYGSGRKDTEKFVYGAITQLDNFLRNPGVKRVLCSRTNNINLDKALEEGQIITACTRQGGLGEIHQKAFGMFVILAFKDAVLRRPGIENTRTPHFIYIDEFPLYVNKDTEAFFTLFRKYRCGTTITIQNLSQLTKTKSLAYFKDVILTNTKTQIIFGDMPLAEATFWSDEMGIKKKWAYTKVLADSSTPEGGAKVDNAFANAKKEDKQKYKPDKIATLGFKVCVYKTKSESGKTITGRGKTSFITDKYYEPHPCAKYNFELFMINKPTSSATSTVSPINFFSESEDKDELLFSDTDVVNTTPDQIIKKPEDKKVVQTEKVKIDVDVDNDGINDFPVILPHIANLDASLKDLKDRNTTERNQEKKKKQNHHTESNPIKTENGKSEDAVLDLSKISDIDSVIIDYNNKK
jgi:hypothetical protein